MPRHAAPAGIGDGLIRTDAMAQRPGTCASWFVLASMKRLEDARFQIVHFSIQESHIHLIVEADG